jgi:hypothetical protein
VRAAPYAWLQNWFWDALDYLEREKHLDVEDMVTVCWADSRFLGVEEGEVISTGAKADDEFTARLEYAIHDAWHQLVIKPERGVANDNYRYEEDFAWWAQS